MPKRIAIVTPVFPPYRGGIGKLAELDARQLAAAGFEVHVFTPKPGESRDAPYALHRLRSLKWGNAAFAPGAGLLLKEFDAVILHYPFFGGAEPLAFAAAIGHRKNLIISYHMDVVGRGPLGAFFWLHARSCMPFIMRRARRVMVTSLDYAVHGMLGRVSGIAARMREVSPSVDVTRFHPGPKSPALLERYGLKDSDQIITFVGGLDRAHYFKGLQILFCALASPSLQTAKVVIAGDGDLRPAYQAFATKLGIADRVIFVGSVSEAELPDVYRLGDVFAFPSIDASEAFGIAALESLASGVPVVASDLPGVRTIVRDGVTGMTVPAGEVALLAARLSALLAQPNVRRRMGVAARAMVEAEYSHAKRAEALRHVVEETI